MIAKRATFAEGFENAKQDYQAAKQGRFRRRRQGVSVGGSGADFHYRSENDFLRIMEYARDMDRNDAIVGQMVDRAVLNIIQNGMTPDPKTGDEGANKTIKDMWWAWATDAQQCSSDGEMVYRDLEKLALRQMFVDGDDISNLLDDGRIELLEAHRMRSPRRTQRNIVHGVELDGRRRRLRYWFTKEEINPLSAVAKVSDLTPREAFDADGYRQILHLRNPKRVTQTRGVSAFAPVFDMLGMHEDLQFSKLVQQQVASCIAILRERSDAFKATGGNDPYGKQSTETFDAMSRIVEELAPGMEVRGLPGEKITGFSPNIPNSEFFQQMRTILQLIGINLGMPLVLLLMDASDTNFSGWRGAMDQAKMGFRDMQQHMIDHWEAPIYLWKLRHFAQEDRALRTLMEKKSAQGGGGGGTGYFAHEWNAPRWPYIQPLQDAQADQLRQRALLASPRRIHGGLAQDWNDTIKETVEDNSFAIEQAATAAKTLSQKTGERVTWREVLFLTDPEMLKVVTTSVATTPQGNQGQTVAAGLNGAQITAAVDVIGKLRSGTMAAPTATELLIAMGFDPARAQAAVDATPAGAGNAEGDRDFLRDVMKSLLGNQTFAAIFGNLMNLGILVEKTGAPRFTNYEEPFAPVVAPAGNLVSGNVIKDSSGDIVGGGLLAAPENTATGDANGSAPPSTTPTTPTQPAPDKTTTEDTQETGGTPAPEKKTEDAQPGTSPENPPAKENP